MNPNPFEKLLDQIAQILQFAYDNADKPISKEKEALLENQLEILKKQMEELKKLNQDYLENSGLSDYVFQTMLDDKKGESISSEHRNILQRAQELKSEASAASKDLLKASLEAKAAGKDLTEKKAKEEKKPKRRQGKFRSMGGTKWKPL